LLHNKGKKILLSKKYFVLLNVVWFYQLLNVMFCIILFGYEVLLLCISKSFGVKKIAISFIVMCVVYITYISPL